MCSLFMRRMFVLGPIRVSVLLPMVCRVVGGGEGDDSCACARGLNLFGDFDHGVRTQRHPTHPRGGVASTAQPYTAVEVSSHPKVEDDRLFPPFFC